MKLANFIALIITVIRWSIVMTQQQQQQQLSGQWIYPFDSEIQLRELCTMENYNAILNDLLILNGKRFVSTLMLDGVLCYTDYESYVPQPYTIIAWFMRSMEFCDLNKVVKWRRRYQNFTRDFQRQLMRAGIALLCRKTDDIGRFHLQDYASIFRMMYERNNDDRKRVCDQLDATYTDIFNRCHVDEAKGAGHLRIMRKICRGRSKIQPIRSNIFFRRFSRNCQSFHEFIGDNPSARMNIGEALANDVVFMNLFSARMTTVISTDSQLPNLVLKTRMLLQHYSLAAIKMLQQIEMAERNQACHLAVTSTMDTQQDKDNSTMPNDTLSSSYEESAFYDESSSIQCSMPTSFDSYYADLPDVDMYRDIGQQAWLFTHLEWALLVAVFLVSIVLFSLLMQAKKQLSTATVLFIFNILFSNLLFLISFACLYWDLIDDSPYGTVNEDHYEGEYRSPALAIAETLQSHLFAVQEASLNLMQETFYSLSQNGSLLGLIHLLVLVLVVINRSLHGKAIELSRRQVISVFALVWSFLIVTHVAFSALQNIAISRLGLLLERLASGRSSTNCSRPIISDQKDIGQHCDNIAIFYTFGVYLLRGNTLFTLSFMLLSLFIFVATVFVHWQMKRANDILNSDFRDQAPNRRREILFHTLLLSICAFFVSVIGEAIIEIAVLLIEDRNLVAEYARWYQLARLAAFVDPLLNPIVVTVRTPALRRRVQRCWRRCSVICFPCCQAVEDFRRRKRSTRQTMSTDSSTAARNAALLLDPNTATGNTNEPISPAAKFIRRLRGSFLRRRSADSNTHNSVV